MAKSLANQKVVVGFPHGHEWSARFGKSLWRLGLYDANHAERIVGDIFNSSGANITNARNEIVAGFLEAHPDVDWLFFVDTDMTFDPDVVDRLVKAAHPEKRPIVGGLCFSIQNGIHAMPTVYAIRPDNKVGRVFDYPRDAIFSEVGGQPILTGTGCVIIHRSVFEKMDASGKFPAAYPYFQETALGGLPMGEDITFMVRAMSLGIPVHVDPTITIGHEKPFIVDQDMFLAQQGSHAAELPIYVIVPFKGKHELTQQLIERLDGYAELFLYDHGSEEPPPAEWNATDAKGWNFHRMWNDGVERALALTGGRCNIAILNNDVAMSPRALDTLGLALRSYDDLVIVSPNYDYREFEGSIQPVRGICAGRYDGTGGMAGFAFMVKGEWFQTTDPKTGRPWRFPEEYTLFFGDSDLALSVEAAGGSIGIVKDVACQHLNGGGNTPRPGDEGVIMKMDGEKFKARWGAE